MGSRRAFWFTLAALAIVGPRALGQVSPIGPFTGAHRENFELSFPLYFQPTLLCFAGRAEANRFGGGMGLAVVSGLHTACGSMQEHVGVRFMVPDLESHVEWVFDEPARRFGGYFGTICQSPGAAAEFYDEAGALIAVLPVACPTGAQWSWNGWKATGPGIKRVRVIASDPDGHVMHDGLQLDFFGDCYGDCDGSGGLTMADFACFEAWFVTADPRADCNASAGTSSLSPPAFTIADFACFQRAFVQGCP